VDHRRLPFATAQNLVAALTSTISPTLIHEFRFNTLFMAIDLGTFLYGTNWNQFADRDSLSRFRKRIMQQNEALNAATAPAGGVALLELGTWLGRHRAFGLIANECSGAEGWPVASAVRKYN
jgi:hypothetical protein